MGESGKLDLVSTTVASGLMGMVAGYSGILENKGVKFNRFEASKRVGGRLAFCHFCFHGARNYLIDKRGAADVFTTIGACCAGAAAFGLTGPAHDRMGSAKIGMAISLPASLICYHIGR